MEYLNFDLKITSKQGEAYPVAARSEAGEARHMMRFPLEGLVLDNVLLRVQNALLRAGNVRRGAGTVEEQTVQSFGQMLFEALLGADVRRLYDASTAWATQADKGVRVRLSIQAPELATLPWEFLYDPLRREYLCFLPDTVLVRYLEIAQPIPPLRVEPPLRVLAMLADPSDQARLNVTHEQQRLLDALGPLEQQDLVKLGWVEGQTAQDLHQALLKRDWHVFHFIGHGAFDPSHQEGMLALVNEQGRTHPLSATDLGRLLTQRSSLRLVVLNACQGAAGDKHNLFSSTAATLASKGIPAVLAMQYDITDHAAIEFTQGFYRALAAGLPVDAAVTQARTAISLGSARTLEWVTPVLYLRAPTGELFTVPPPTTRPYFTPAKSVFKLKNGLTRRQLIAVGVGGAIGIGGLIGAGEIWQTATSHGQTVAHSSTPTPISYGKVPLGKPLYTYRGHSDKVNGVAWSPDGRRIASASSDQTVQVWGATDGSHVFTYRGHSDVVGPVTWSPDGKRIASGGSDNTVQVWDATDGGNVFTYRGHSALVIRIAWSPDGRRIASGSFDGTVQVWNAADGGNVYTDRGHAANIVEGMDWSPNGKRIASSGGNPDFTVQVWDATDGGNRLVGNFPTIMRVVKWSHDSRHIAVGNYRDGIVYILLDGGNDVFIRQGHAAGVLDITWSPDDRRIASASTDHTVQVWNAVDGSNGFTYYGHAAEVGGVAWSPDGSRIASGSFDETVQVWGAG